jgi:hypothetical protein
MGKIWLLLPHCGWRVVVKIITNPLFHFESPLGLQFSSDGHHLFYGRGRSSRNKHSHCSSHSGGCFPDFCTLDRQLPIDEVGRKDPLP